MTLVRNEFKPFVVCAYTIERACVCAHACTCNCVRAHMHLDTREFACVHTHKCKRSFLRAFACFCERAFACVGLIKTQNAFALKNRKTQTQFGFRNFQDVRTICMYVCTIAIHMYTMYAYNAYTYVYRN